jgi:hypothetical protein
MFILATLIILATAILLNATLRFRSLIAQYLSIYIFTFADIAFILHIANLFHRMNQEWVVILIAAINFGIVYGLWKHNGSADPFGVFKKTVFSIRTLNFRNLFRKYPYIPMLIIVVGIGYLLIAILIYVVPPNNVDSVSTHMSRVIYWLHHGDYFPWDTIKKWQLIYPVNAQLLSFWSILFTKTDHFVGYGQFFAAIFSALAITGITKLNGRPNKHSVFSAIIFLTLPAVALQASTTQNDLFITALFIISIYFFFYGITEKRLTAFTVSGISIGLAVGTKQTMFFLLVPYVILYLMAWLLFKKVTFRQLFHLGWVSILTFLLIGSQIFISNIVNFGHPLGSPETVQSQSGSLLSSDQAVEIISLNSARFTYQMADLSGLPDPLWGYGIKLKALISKPIFGFLHMDVESGKGTYPGHHFSLLSRTQLQEDFAWYGPLGFLILVPLVFYALMMGIKKKNIYYLAGGIFFFLFQFLIIFFRPGWDPYQGRYFMPIVALLTPILGDLANDRLISKISMWIISAIAISTLVSCLFLNPAKPITGGRSVWHLDRLELLNYQNTYLVESMEIIDENLPLNTTVGLASDSYYFIEYPFFGRDFSRNLIPIYPDEKLYREDFFKENNIKYVIFYTMDKNLNDIPYLMLIATSEKIQLYQYIAQ